jgi:hypothetical protein
MIVKSPNQRTKEGKEAKRIEDDEALVAPQSSVSSGGGSGTSSSSGLSSPEGKTT